MSNSPDLFQEEREKNAGSPLKPDKTFGLNVSGDVMLNNMEVEIVDTRSFQRLAYIRQLGSTNTVYRSANHTRFEHSIGVLKMAQLMIQKISNNKHSSKDERKITEEEEQIIRLLALLHDIGHMPFGHTIEDEFNIFESHDKHESRWEYFLGESSEIGKIIIKYWDSKFHKRFFQLIKCEKDFTGFEEDAFMYDIVSNTVCADLLDYLHRDCQYTNLKLNFHPRFLDYLVIKQVKNEERSKIEGKEVVEKRIVIRLCKTRNKQPRKDIQSELVQLLRNRYYLGERVYYHHTKIKTGTLVAAAVMRAKEANVFNYLEGYDPEDRKYMDGDGPLYEAHLWGDTELLVNLKNTISIGQGKKNKLISGVKRLTNYYFDRLVYHELLSFSKKDLGLSQSTIDEIINKKIGRDRTDIFEMQLINDFGDSSSRLHKEELLTEFLPDMNSGDFLIYFPNYKMQMKLARVKVEDSDGIARPLMSCKDEIIREECAEVIKKHKDIWRLRFFIHPKYIAPLTEQQKTSYREKFGQNYNPEYKTYIQIIHKYCKLLVSPNPTERKTSTEDFWRGTLRYILETKLDDTVPTEDNTFRPSKNGNGRKNRNMIVTEIAEELTSNTALGRNIDEITRLLTTRFKENSKL